LFWEFFSTATPWVQCGSFRYYSLSPVWFYWNWHI